MFNKEEEKGTGMFKLLEAEKGTGMFNLK